MPTIDSNKNTADVVETSIDLTKVDKEATWAKLAKSRATIRRWFSEMKDSEETLDTEEPTEKASKSRK